MNIFEKNIEALKLKNPELASVLKTYIPDEIPQLVNKNGSYNLLYKGCFLHNEISPLGEAKEIFSMAENNPVTIHLIYGLGLGYLFQLSSANSIGTVILYEPDLNIMKIALSLVDFSADIIKPNVFITHSLKDTENLIWQKSSTKNLPLLLTTIAYRELNKNCFDDLVSELQRQVGSYKLDLDYTKEKFSLLTSRIIEYIPELIKETPLDEIKNYYEGKTAVVASAGPTLDRTIETIKKFRNNIVLISVGTAMKALEKNGLTPDFLCIIEANDCSKQIEGLDLSEVNFVTEPYSHPNLRNGNYKKIYSHPSSNMPVNTFWCNLAGIQNNNYLSKGTVSYTALNVARILGCKKIVLAGQDLAYIEGQCYSKDSAYKDLICTYNEAENKWEIKAKDFDNFVKSLGNNPDPEIQKKIALERLDNLNKSLYYVKGINGNMIPTESVYAAFINPLAEFTQMFPNAEYINTSLVGAQIDGFKNLPIEEALKDSTPVENRLINTDFQYDINGIKNRLSAAKEEIISSQQICSDIIRICRNLNNEIKRQKNLTGEILKGLKTISEKYTKLRIDLSDRSKLFDIITMSEKIEMDYQMKMFQGVNGVNVKSVSEMTEKFIWFCESVETKVKETSALIDNTLGRL